jgi:hypothetical protein
VEKTDIHNTKKKTRRRGTQDQNKASSNSSVESEDEDDDMTETYDRACKVDWDDIIETVEDGTTTLHRVVNMIPNHHHSSTCPTTIRVIGKEGETDIPINSDKWRVWAKGETDQAKEVWEEIQNAEGSRTHDQEKRIQWQQLLATRRLSRRAERMGESQTSEVQGVRRKGQG